MQHEQSDSSIKTIFCIAISSPTTCSSCRWIWTHLLPPNLRTLARHARCQNWPINTRQALAHHRTWHRRFYRKSLMTPRPTFTGMTWIRSVQSDWQFPISFGILLWALYTQQEPYIWIEHSWEVAQYVLQGKRDKIPADCPSLYAQLIEQCWTQDPDQRPNMESVISALENIVKMSKFWTGM